MVTWSTQGYAGEIGTPDNYVEWFEIPHSRENSLVHTYGTFEVVVLGSGYSSCSLAQGYEDKVLKVCDFNIRCGGI